MPSHKTSSNRASRRGGINQWCTHRRRKPASASSASATVSSSTTTTATIVPATAAVKPAWGRWGREVYVLSSKRTIRQESSPAQEAIVFDDIHSGLLLNALHIAHSRFQMYGFRQPDHTSYRIDESGHPQRTPAGDVGLTDVEIQQRQQSGRWRYLVETILDQRKEVTRDALIHHGLTMVPDETPLCEGETRFVIIPPHLDRKTIAAGNNHTVIEYDYLKKTWEVDGTLAHRFQA